MVKNAINRAYADTCLTVEAFQSKSTVSPSSGGTYTFASTVLRPKVFQITSGSVKYRQLQWRSLDEILAYRAQASSSPTTGPPTYYTLDGSLTMEVYPDF